MKLPWNHGDRFEADPNPNGFYPDPPQVIHICRCLCGDARWTFTPEDASEYIDAHHVHGHVILMPASAGFRLLADRLLDEAAHTIGPRT